METKLNNNQGSQYVYDGASWRLAIPSSFVCNYLISWNLNNVINDIDYDWCWLYSKDLLVYV